jgi:hypothetical protein
MTSTFDRWRLIYLLHLLPLIVALALIHAQAAQAPKSQPVIPIYDCRLAWVQNGVRVRRLSDHKVTRIDVCGAADSSDDTFRDIPYEGTN